KVEKWVADVYSDRAAGGQRTQIDAERLARQQVNGHPLRCEGVEYQKCVLVTAVAGQHQARVPQDDLRASGAVGDEAKEVWVRRQARDLRVALVDRPRLPRLRITGD